MREFVIERTNEMKREWWTGTQWSDDETEARWYSDEPDAPEERRTRMPGPSAMRRV